MEYRAFLGGLAALLSFVSYAPYFHGLIKREIKPHAFTWCIWMLIVGIAFAVQVTEGAGAGAWVTGCTSLLCLTVFIVALFRGEKDIRKSDVISFMAALLVIPIWIVTKEAVLAAILVSLIDMLGFYPTFRKSWMKPYEEKIITYALSAMTFALGLMALNEWTLANYIYPAAVLITNTSFVVMALMRRTIISNCANLNKQNGKAA